MKSLRKQLFATVALLAVVFAQVFGLQRGYACTHGENTVEMAASHCHQLAEAESSGHVPCELPCEDTSSKEEHAPVVVNLTARDISTFVDAPEFVAVPTIDLIANEWALQAVLAEAVTARSLPLSEEEKPLCTGVQVARCLVLLV